MEVSNLEDDVRNTLDELSLRPLVDELKMDLEQVEDRVEQIEILEVQKQLDRI